LECALHCNSSAKNKFNFTRAVIRSERSCSSLYKAISAAAELTCMCTVLSAIHQLLVLISIDRSIMLKKCY